ncbi:hypothetical protein F5Y14DRAFT_83968 [Nemania sp. NC0429]|nr:hypothetical protein F5Y14DRAFT_83968 [Nemania sp. NC0429]
MSADGVHPNFPPRAYFVTAEGQDPESPQGHPSLSQQPSTTQWRQPTDQQPFQPQWHQPAHEQPSQPQWSQQADQQSFQPQWHLPADQQSFQPQWHQPVNQQPFQPQEHQPADQQSFEPQWHLPADQDHEENQSKSEPVVVEQPFQPQHFAEKDYLARFFPQINDKDSLRAWKSKRSRTLVLQIALVVAVLLANIALTIFAVRRYPSVDGIGMLYDNDCTTVNDLDRYLHLLINILSTGLLSASNYCMQLQAAPTRAEIDRAHRQGRWLDIGVPSLRNLAFISNWRRFSWALLAISSVPVHLIYNSAVFQTLASNEYAVAVVKDSFIQGSPWSLTTAQTNQQGAISWNQSYTHPINPEAVDMSTTIAEVQQAVMNDQYKPMNISACFDFYNDFFAAQGNVVVLVKNQSVQATADDSLLMYQYIIPGPNNYPKNMWMSSNGSADWVALEPRPPVSTLFLGPPKYEMSSCLVQPPDLEGKRCFLQYSPPILYVIISLNILKAIILLCVWILRQWQEKALEKQEAENADADAVPKAPQNQVLYTLGDAIASFLREPAPETADRCLAPREDFLTKRRFRNRWIKERPDLTQHVRPKPYKKEDRYWGSAASPRRWFVLLALCLGVIILVGVLLGLGIISLKSRYLPTDIPGLSALGFGALGQYTFLNNGLSGGGSAGFVRSVLVANLPQLIISFLYLFYNSMVSTFLVQREFSRMHLEKNRKTLRVSEPVGIQRSSYFISLPLKYGIPLYASSAVLHWLASQSLFLARIAALKPDGTTDEANSFSDPATSPLAIFVTILVGFGFLLVVVILGFRKYDGTMRMVATNSLAISAACHALQEDRADAYQLPIRWAVVEVNAEGVGHCAFTTAPDSEIRPPREGGEYQ